ncbi:ABC transporter permease [Bosea caraganae]|uniref:ABC transporter permease n=2 Tax=Bosea caraganae TaxID=2763117 RepID=A0A370L0E7_9HYPH|nr:ABC transporter permease [Bosea caraganae]RDJ29000.1 ABC transporter permease [Bosea caraganae]
MSGDMERFLLPPDAGAEDFARVRHEYGLDQPLYLQYLFFIAKAVTGDFGTSWRWHDPAWTVVVDRLPATLQLAAAAALIAFLIAITVGPLSAARPGSWIDRIGRVFAILGQSMPAFWVGLMLIRIFAVDLRWLPSYGRGDLSNLVMPAISLGWYAAAAQTRLMRSAMLNVLDSEYIKLARLKGVPEFYVIYKHGLRNAALPVLTLMGVQWAALLSGSVVIETIFAWPGVGRTIVEAIFNRDYAVVQAGTFMMSLIFVGANLTVDLLYGVLDPRIRNAR